MILAYILLDMLKVGIHYEVISGSNATLLAAAASGLVEKEFIFLSFLPNTGKERTKAIENALNLWCPAVIMSHQNGFYHS